MRRLKKKIIFYRHSFGDIKKKQYLCIEIKENIIQIIIQLFENQYKSNTNLLKFKIMKARFIVKCELGFVNAEWQNGKKYPECWGFSNYEAISYTESRAEILRDLVINNNHTAQIICIL